jgi:hypothetical protein
VESWFEQYVRAPALGLLESLPVSGQTVDHDECQALAVGIDGCFMIEAPHQYAPWPPESTTDGTAVSLITRIDERTLDAVGVTYIDFSGEVFPSRALVVVDNEATTVVGFIGQTDERTGAPPRLPRGTLINTPRDLDRGVVTPTLIVGRREILPKWTTVFEMTGD